MLASPRPLDYLSKLESRDGQGVLSPVACPRTQRQHDSPSPTSRLSPPDFSSRLQIGGTERVAEPGESASRITPMWYAVRKFTGLRGRTLIRKSEGPCGRRLFQVQSSDAFLLVCVTSAPPAAGPTSSVPRNSFGVRFLTAEWTPPEREFHV